MAAASAKPAPKGLAALLTPAPPPPSRGRRRPSIRGYRDVSLWEIKIICTIRSAARKA